MVALPKSNRSSFGLGFFLLYVFLCMFMLHAHVVPFLDHPAICSSSNLPSPSHSSSLSFGTPLPHPSLHRALPNVSYYVVFVIHHTLPQSIYIHAHLYAYVLYSCQRATKIPTTFVGEDLDPGFPDDAGGDPIEPRGLAESSPSDM